MRIKYSIALLAFLSLPITDTTASNALRLNVASDDTILIEKDELIGVLKNAAIAVMKQAPGHTNQPMTTYSSLSGGQRYGETVDINQRLDRIETMLSAALGARGTVPSNGMGVVTMGYMPYNGAQLPVNQSTMYAHDVNNLQRQINQLEKQIELLAKTVADKDVQNEIASLSKQLNSLKPIQPRAFVDTNRQIKPVAAPELIEIADAAVTVVTQVDTVSVTEIIHTGFHTVQRQVFFGVSSDQLSTEAEKTLKEIVKILADNRSLKVELIGYSSKDGRADYNRGLAEKRLKRVKAFLLSQGVKKSQIGQQSFGIDKTSDLKTYARRVELCVSQ